MKNNFEDPKKDELKKAIAELKGSPDTHIPNLDTMLERPGEKELWESKEPLLLIDASKHPYKLDAFNPAKVTLEDIKALPAGEVPVWAIYVTEWLGGGDEAAVLFVPPEKFAELTEEENTIESYIVRTGGTDDAENGLILKDGTRLMSSQVFELANSDPDVAADDLKKPWAFEKLAEKYFADEIQFIVYSQTLNASALAHESETNKPKETTRVIGEFKPYTPQPGELE